MPPRSPPTNPPEQPTGPPPSQWQDEGLEFQVTDFGEARRILDDESIAQFHVETVVSPAQLKRIRRATLPTDRALSGQAIDWLMSFPAGLRPEQLGSQFPRIANALAALWPQPDECLAALERLLADGRPGRSGFPREVHADLVALRDGLTGLRDWNEPF
jgi:hypothetical protein